MDNPVILAIVAILFLTIMTIVNVEWWAPWYPGLFSKFIWRNKKKVKKLWTKKERNAHRTKMYLIQIIIWGVFIVIFLIYDSTT